MAEFLSAGVFIEEVPSQLQTVLAVSTSTMGAAGYTYQGPVEDPILITSLDQYNRKFGPFTQDSLLGMNVAAFFYNGGRRAYIDRVIPGDAVEADCRLQGDYSNQQLFKGDGATLIFSATASTTQFKASDAPLVPSSIGLRWRTAGTPKTDKGVMNRAESSILVGANGTAVYEGIVTSHYSLKVVGAASPDGDNLYVAKAAGDQSAITVEHVVGVGALSVAVVGTAITVTPAAAGSTAAQVATAVNAHAQASLLVSCSFMGDGTGNGAAAAAAPLATQAVPTFDDELDSFVPGTVVLKWYAGGSQQTAAITTKTSSIVTQTVWTSPNQATVTLDTRTGRFSISLTGTMIPGVGDAGSPFLANYTPASATVTDTDDGAGAWTTLTGTLTYADGAYAITFATAPHDQARVLAAYTLNAWDLDPISKGVWGNDIKVQISGNPDYYSVSTASYSRYNFFVRQYNSSSATYDVVEQFEEIPFDDSTSVQYFPDVINELSDYVNVVEPGSDYNPQNLNGFAKVFVPAGGDESTGGQTIQTTIPTVPINPRSVSIVYTDSTGTARTITDDGSGNLVGDVDVGGTNTVEYTTGAVDVKTGYVMDGGTLVVISYYTAPDETNHYELFGDTTKQYTYGTVTYYQSGDDGTFDATNYGRSQFTSPTLVANSKGIFALSKVEEILQVILPDFAGDVTITGDLLDYASSRAALPHGGDRFIILTVPMGSSPQEAVDWFRYDLGRYSDYAAIYWPWVKIADPLANNRPKLIPPLGHLAGIYARTDVNRTVAKAPAGTVDGQLSFLTGLEYVSTQGERDLVYPNKINPLISGTNTGLAVWGARTISSQSQWRYVPVRRLFMFLEKSVYNSTFWAVFEPNGPSLWSQIQSQISSFLLGLYNQGYFAGNSPSQAFFVICDSSNNDQASIDAGQVVCDIGVAPLKPGEFIRFRFAQKAL